MQIFIALVLAIAAGLLMQNYAAFANTYIKPFGTIFLNLVKFIVVPIVLFSIMCDIISMRDIKKVGSIGLKTVVYYMCTTAFAITIGLIGGNLFKGMFPVIATTNLSYKMGETTSLMDTLVNIFPSNFVSPMVEANMLQVIVMAVLLGFGIILIGEEQNHRLVTAFNITNRCILLIMSSYRRKWSHDHWIISHGIISSIYLLHCTCSACLFRSSKDNGWNKSNPVLQRDASSHHVCILKCIIRRNTSYQLRMCRRTRSRQRDRILRTSIRSYDQHGRNCNLSGSLCDLHCILLRNQSYIITDVDSHLNSNTRLHRNSRSSRSRNGYAGYGINICRTTS